jgi:hypothetical protein
MANDSIKRLRYFTGQFLEAVDFKAEQDYHVGVRRRGNRALYVGAGILDEGFQVKLKTGDPTKVIIGPGIGIDGVGRDLVLLNELECSLPQRAGSMFITLRYAEQETDQQVQDQDISDNSRFEEKPSVGFYANLGEFDNQTDIVIARIPVDAQGRAAGSSDMSVRQLAKARFAGSLTIGKGSGPAEAALEIDRGETNDLALRLSSAGPGWGSGLQLRNTTANGKRFGIYSGADGRLHVADVESRVDRLTIAAAGEVGIGTSAPKAAFHVNGIGLVSDGDGYAVPNNRMARGSLTIGSLTASFGGGTSWNSNTAGLLLETLANTEIAVHDSGTRLASVVYYEGEATNRLTIGRDMGWGPISSVVVGGALHAGSSDLYFTKTNHNHTGFGNTAGYAAIENSTQPYDALMILGRADAPKPGQPTGAKCRVVKLWDFLDVNGDMRVTGTITPAAGNSEGAGIMFPKDPGGGSGDAAWIRYYARSGENTTLEIGTSNDPEDHIAFMASGNVGIGTKEPSHKLDVNGSARVAGDLTVQGSVSLAGDVRFGGKSAVRGNDSWLRLNQDGTFPSGVHTPFVFAPGSLNVGGMNGWGNPGPGNAWVTGSITYGGQLNKLDVAEGDGFASIGAHDLFFGHSTRHGGLGRAIVDEGRFLTLNFGRDWPDGIRYEGSFQQKSSRNLKEGIRALRSDVASRIVAALEPVGFCYQSDASKSDHLGFIAEDVPPEVASSDRQAINVNHILAALTRVVKDQQRLIETLESRLSLLEQRNQRNEGA